MLALTFSSRIDRRQALMGMLATGGILASPMRALAVGDPAPDKAYAAFFLGQGGYLFSWGIPYLASQAQALGMETDIFGYSQVREAWKKIIRKKNDGYKIALVGYSLGNTTITYLQQYLVVDLLLAISESSLGLNHPIKRENTRRSVLWYGPDLLSNAGLQDGFDKINYVNNSHLWMNVDSRVVSSVLGELQDLVRWDRNNPSELAEELAIGLLTAARADGAGEPEAERAPDRGGQWPSTSLPITGDITCARCWGFEANLKSLP